MAMLNNQRVYIFIYIYIYIYIFINPIYGDVWRIKNQFIRVVWASPKVCILRIFQIFRTIDPEMEWQLLGPGFGKNLELEKRNVRTVSICIPQRCFLKHVSRISGNSANVSASPLAPKSLWPHAFRSTFDSRTGDEKKSMAGWFGQFLSFSMIS